MPNISEYNSYKADLEKQGKTLVAVAVVKYPTYMLHLELKKPNDDPMFHGLGNYAFRKRYALHKHTFSLKNNWDGRVFSSRQIKKSM